VKHSRRFLQLDHDVDSILQHHLAPEQFHNEQERILWALTFFKGSCAAKWSENVFCQEADTGVFPIQTWGDFEQQFRVYFFPVNMVKGAKETISLAQAKDVVPGPNCMLKSLWK